MSQQEPHIKEIGGHVFTVFKLPPRLSQRCLIPFVQMLAPAAAGILSNKDIRELLKDGGDDGGGEDEALKKVLDGDVGKLGQSLLLLLQSLDADKLEVIENELMKVTHVDGKPLEPLFDAFFVGDKMMLMYQWLGFAAKVQWGNFVGLAARFGAARSGAEKSQST